MAMDASPVVVDSAVPFAPVEMPADAPVESTTPPRSSSKNWLGTILPKVPTIRKKQPQQPPLPLTSSSPQENGTPPEEMTMQNQEQEQEQHDAENEKDIVTKEKLPLTTRLRGLSLVGKFPTLRSTSSISTGDSPRTSLEEKETTTNDKDTSPRSSTADGNSGWKARRGACVATKFGTGTILDVRSVDGFYVVQLIPKSIAYLREDMVIREIKAVVGERVKTRWGLATVEQYYVDEDMYSIALDWRWDDDHVWRMKATTKKFEKISRSMILMQNTKNRLFEGYSAVRESASSGYANVAAKINTTTSTIKPVTRSSSHNTPQALPEGVGKALTPFGVCTVLEVRPDQSFVCETKCGATAYFHADSVKLLHRRTNFAVGDRVKTPYGLGEVVEYRDDDEVYAIKLEATATMGTVPPMLYISDLHADSMMMVASSANGTNSTRFSSILNMTRNSVFSASASVKASATGGFHTLSNVKSKVSTMAAIKMT